MELGTTPAPARTSRVPATRGYIRRFPEYGDLLARMDALDRRAALEAAASATPPPAAADRRARRAAP